MLSSGKQPRDTAQQLLYAFDLGIEQLWTWDVMMSCACGIQSNPWAPRWHTYKTFCETCDVDGNLTKKTMGTSSEHECYRHRLPKARIT
jgi:hypothetical protein